MPTYDYECKACKHIWDEFQSMSAKPTKKCPKCGKAKAKRKIGAGAGIIFKGSGFYQTDYRSDSYKKAASADSNSGDAKPAKAADGATPSTKSEGSSGDKASKSKAPEKNGGKQ